MHVHALLPEHPRLEEYVVRYIVAYFQLGCGVVYVLLFFIISIFIIITWHFLGGG